MTSPFRLPDAPDAPRPLPPPADDRLLGFCLAVIAVCAALSFVLFVVGPVWP